MHFSREPRKAQMPTQPVFGHSPHTKISSRFGKTPTLIFPSSSKRKRSTRASSDSSHSEAFSQKSKTRLIIVGSANFSRITLVLFRTRRRDEYSKLQEGVRRRVRKSTSVTREY